MPAPEPRQIGPDKPITTGDLAPGTYIWRWTEPVHPGTKVTAAMPCHESQTVMVATTTGHAVAVCRICSTTYDLEISDEGDGGHAACFRVAYRPFVLSRTRRTKR